MVALLPAAILLYKQRQRMRSHRAGAVVAKGVHMDHSTGPGLPGVSPGVAGRAEPGSDEVLGPGAFPGDRPVRRRVANRWTVSLTAALTAAFPAEAESQDTELEEIFVTGSRIARPDFESASPIVSITQQSFQQSSSTSVDTVMNRLPQFVPDFGSTSNNPGNGGQGNLQLRGLGPRRTLVLMDGRR
jgi:TonB-dependent Receptor Plug Domain